MAPIYPRRFLNNGIICLKKDIFEAIKAALRSFLPVQQMLKSDLDMFNQSFVAPASLYCSR